MALRHKVPDIRVTQTPADTNLSYYGMELYLSFDGPADVFTNAYSGVTMDSTGPEMDIWVDSNEEYVTWWILLPNFSNGVVNRVWTNTAYTDIPANRFGYQPYTPIVEKADEVEIEFEYDVDYTNFVMEDAYWEVIDWTEVQTRDHYGGTFTLDLFDFDADDARREAFPYARTNAQNYLLQKWDWTNGLTYY